MLVKAKFPPNFRLPLAHPQFLRKEPMAEKNPEERGQPMGFSLKEFGSSS